MIWLILFAAIVLFLVAAPFIIEFLRPRMNSYRRIFAPGEFSRLSMGLTHYLWQGPKDGQIVVCVHGLTTPSFVWNPIASALSEQGYRVLSYDFPGRGYSDRPTGIQNCDFFIAHLDELLESQGVAHPFILCGYSMGGAIAAAYGSRYPKKVKRLALLAPAGIGHDLGPLSKFAVKYGFLGKWLFYAVYPMSLRKSIAAEWHLKTPSIAATLLVAKVTIAPERHLKSPFSRIPYLQIEETRLKGFTPSVLSSLRAMICENLQSAHREIAKNGPPLLAIWGDRDDVIPIQGMETLAKWNPDAHQEVVENAGHSLAYTHHTEVVRAVCKFLE